MNGITREIAQILKIELSDAVKIQNYIDNNWLLDWSECSQSMFERVIRRVAKVVL